MNIGSPGTHSKTTRHEADFCSLAFYQLTVDANLRQVEGLIDQGHERLVEVLQWRGDAQHDFGQ